MRYSERGLIWGQYPKMLLLLLLLGPSMSLTIWVVWASVCVYWHEWHSGRRLWTIVCWSKWGGTFLLSGSMEGKGRSPQSGEMGDYGPRESNRKISWNSRHLWVLWVFCWRHRPPSSVWPLCWQVLGLVLSSLKIQEQWSVGVERPWPSSAVQWTFKPQLSSGTVSSQNRASRWWQLLTWVPKVH